MSGTILQIPMNIRKQVFPMRVRLFTRRCGDHQEFYMTGNLLDYDRTPQLKEIDIPTLFTCGRYDEATPEATTWYQSLLPKSEIAIFEQSAHMAHLEETECHLQIVQNFLQRIDYF